MLCADDIDQISVGPAAAETLDALRRTRVARTALLLTRLAREHPELRGPIDVIAAAQESRPAAVADLLAWPWVCVWAAETVRAPVDERAVRYLSGLVVAAADRAALPSGDVRTAAGDGDLLMIPRYGAWSGGRGRRGAARWPVRYTGPRWQPVRVLHVTHRGCALDLVLDDLDPYRRWDLLPVSPRLSGPAVAAWQGLLGAAWELLVEHAPSWASELRAGLTCLVPLQATPDGLGRSSTHRESLGGLASAYRADASWLAVTLVHEFQHSKLNQLLSRVRLCDVRHRRGYVSPWRTDPRPLVGLLHGLYAFTAVAELWWGLRHAPGLAVAEDEFAVRRRQVSQALATVTASPGLTQEGRRFVAGIARRVDALMARPVDRCSDARARRLVREVGALRPHVFTS